MMPLSGYEGRYATAITQDGAIVADFITAGELNAGIITTGILSSRAGETWINLDDGSFGFGDKFEMDSDGNMAIEGKIYGPYRDQAYAAVGGNGVTGDFGVVYKDFGKYSDIFTVSTDGDNAVVWRCMSDNGVLIREIRFGADGSMQLYTQNGAACWITLDGKKASVDIDGNFSVNGEKWDNVLRRISVLEAKA